MKVEEFNKLLDESLEHIRDVLDSKAKEYSNNDDRLKNFKDAAKFEEEEPEKSLRGMWVKHLTKLRDYITRLDNGDISSVSAAQWQEVIFDTINYPILLLALLKERGLV